MSGIVHRPQMRRTNIEKRPLPSTTSTLSKHIWHPFSPTPPYVGYTSSADGGCNSTNNGESNNSNTEFESADPDFCITSARRRYGVIPHRYSSNEHTKFDKTLFGTKR
jgi:hypothetical protein